MQHRELAAGRWGEMSLMEQMANIGSEVSRTARWLHKGNEVQARKAFDRSLELIDLTIKFGRLNEGSRGAMLTEICRFREFYCGAFLAKDLDEIDWFNNKYLMPFAVGYSLKNRKG